MPPSDQELLDVLANALTSACDEWGGHVQLNMTRLALTDDLPAIDISVTHAGAPVQEARVFICNKPTQGGGLKRQLDRVLVAMKNRSCFMLRASDFPPNRKNQTAQAFRKFRESGGRSLLVPIPEWERMLTVREFASRNRLQAGFADWFCDAKLLSGVLAVIQLLRLDLLGRPATQTALQAPTHAPPAAWSDPAATSPSGADGIATASGARQLLPSDLPVMPMDPLADWTGWGGDFHRQALSRRPPLGFSRSLSRRSSSSPTSSTRMPPTPRASWPAASCPVARSRSR